jgi:hypothetical protein
MKKFIGILFAFVALVACTVKLSAILNVSDILSDQNKALMVDVRILVMNCDEDSIAEIQTAFEKRKISARFNKCGSEDMFNEYAGFSLPIAIVHDVSKPIPVENGIYFYVADDTLSLRTSDNFASMLASDSDFDDGIEISSIEFSLTNDGMSDFVIKPWLVFVDERPVFDSEITVPSFSKVSIKLPDVANKLLEKSNAEYPIFRFVRND